MFGAKLFSLRKKKNLSQQKLADLLNENYQTRISKSMISRWEKDQTDPQMEYVRILADFFDVSINEIIGNSFQNDILYIYNQLNEQDQKDVYNYATTKLNKRNKIINFSDYIEEFSNEFIVDVTARTSAGTGTMLLDYTETYPVTVKNSPPNDYDHAWQVNGDSMEPLFEDGEIIYTKKIEQIQQGQILVISLDGELFVKKVHLSNDCLKLISINKNYKDIVANENNNIQILGRVIL